MEKYLSRRSFLKNTCSCAYLTMLPVSGLSSIPTSTKTLPIHLDLGKKKLSLSEAMHYKKLAEESVECNICPRKCKVAKQERGYCGVKVNYYGKYYTLVHSRACTFHIDPIEKKPLFPLFTPK